MKPQDFFGKAQRLPVGIIESVAKQQDLEPEAIQALINVESGKSGFMLDGRPYILFEAHWFSKFTESKYDETHPNISSAKWNRYLYGAPGRHQYERLETAMQLNTKAALKSCSWGRFQIMGFHYKTLGYDTVEEMVEAFCDSEEEQFKGFIAFIKDKNILQPLREKDWPLVAYRYNGSGYRENRYDEKLAQEYKSLKSFILRRGSRGSKVQELQRNLNKRGYKISADGYFGLQTEKAVKEYQSSAGLTSDGIVGPQTFGNLAADKLGSSPATSKRVIGSLGLGAMGVGELIKVVGEAHEQATQSVENIKGVIVSPIGQSAVNSISKFAGLPLDKYIVPMLIIGFAVYFIWTKIADYKKERGVQ